MTFILNSPTLANATAAYDVGLRRLPDCSLDEDITIPRSTPLSNSYVTSLTGAQDYFHQLAGLTTTPDVFAKGCDYQILGLPATSNILLLGSTSDGAAISAELADSGLYVSVTDFTANKQTNTQLTTSQSAGFFSAASLRSNGIMDIVETSLTDPATQKLATAVFLGNGDGTFQAPVYYDVTDNGLGQFTIDDVNGDGKPDIVELVSQNFTVANITVLLGNGDGTFTAGPVSPVTGVNNDQPATGDFNGDNKKDLLVGGTVLFGGGDGTFTVGPTNAAINSTVNYLFPPAVGDLRNSGKLDVVVSTSGNLAIFYGNGDGTFTAGPTYAALPDYEQITLTDIDGDGNLDIFLGTSTGGVYASGGYDMEFPAFQILMGHGDGTFVDAPTYAQGTYSPAGGPQIASADFNGDGNADVLAFQDGNGITGNTLLMFPGNGTGALGTAVTSTFTASASQMVSADMNGDHKPDAVLAGGTQVAVILNQGDGTFADEQDYTLPDPAVSLAVGDFNGDGYMDVAVGVSSVQVGGSGPSGVYVLMGQANGMLGSPVQIDTSLYPVGLAAASLTSDGRTDLVVADEGATSPQVNGAIHVYLGNADGSFTAATAPTTTATNYSVAALGDLNNDGKTDLIVTGTVPGANGAAATPMIYTLLGNGDGTFQAASALALSDADGFPNTIALADFNKSGNMGVVIGNPNDYTEILLGNGDGTLTDTLLTLGQRPSTVAAADLMGNGYPALLVGQPSIVGPDTLAVFANSTIWTATSPSLIATTTALSASATTVTVGANVQFTATITPASGTATPTGTVTFMDGTTMLGSGTISDGVATYSTTSLSAGAHSITAVYGGDTSFSGSTSSASTVTVNAVTTPVATTTSLTASATSATTGANIIFTAMVTPASGTAIPSGTVTFFDGTDSLGTETLGSSSSATLSTTALAVGSHSITAQYAGDTNFTGSTSGALAVAISAPAPDFSFSISPASGTETAAAPANAMLTVTPTNGFNASVSFTCSGLPSGVSCSFNPATVTPSGSAATTTVTFAATTSAMAQPANGAGRAPLIFAALGFGFWLLGRTRRHRTLLRGLSIIALAAALTGLVGCGGSHKKSTTQTSTVTITATAGSTSHTATYSLQSSGS